MTFKERFDSICTKLTMHCNSKTTWEAQLFKTKVKPATPGRLKDARFHHLPYQSHMNVGMDRKQVDRKDVLMLRLFEGKLVWQVRERYVGRLRY